MPSWPPADGHTTVTTNLPAAFRQHLDQEADYRGYSRAAHIRQLVLADRKRRTQHALLPIPTEDTKAITLEISTPLAEHLKDQAGKHGTSVNQYLRQLIAQDVKRAAPRQLSSVAGS